MPIVSKLNYLRISPRKVRLVADLIRNKKVGEAERILNFTVKRAAKPIAKLLKTALADAGNNFHIESNNLYISKIIVNEGPKYKRWRARSRGMANPIIKRTSHITLVLDEIEASKGNGDKIKKQSRGLEAKNKKVLSAKKTKRKREEKPAAKEKQMRSRPETEALKHKPKAPSKLKRIFRRKAF